MSIFRMRPPAPPPQEANDEPLCEMSDERLFGYFDSYEVYRWPQHSGVFATVEAIRRLNVRLKRIEDAMARAKDN